jgi:hypothetical protein
LWDYAQEEIDNEVALLDAKKYDIEFPNPLFLKWNNCRV